MKIKTFCGGYDHNFSYVIHNDTKACLIDPALPAEEIVHFVTDRKLHLQFVVFLHSHFDHIIDLEKYRAVGIPIYGHESTKITVDRRLKDDEFIGFDEIKLKVLHTPGHRYDCICLLLENHLFTSDTLFVESCGRVDLPGSDPQLMVRTLEKLRTLPENTLIYPGHDYGPTPRSTIGTEKVNNPFLKTTTKIVTF
ncbi:MAG: MBL fold metallo-hydrolase [Nanoarchaeota archaeon]|nr:MBL fold metallo-hydrolase [Nanoarchaeota archaeon]